uniref:Uncharacterized protein n=1 Tax=Arundo donax TaxID=35708 RepID=A0A0A9FNH6_ARUDO
MEKMMERILSNHVSEVSNINSSVQWIILWSIFICFLSPICDVVSQISYTFRIRSLPVFTTVCAFSCPIAANLSASKPLTV